MSRLAVSLLVCLTACAGSATPAPEFTHAEPVSEPVDVPLPMPASDPSRGPEQFGAEFGAPIAALEGRFAEVMLHGLPVLARGDSYNRNEELEGDLKRLQAVYREYEAVVADDERRDSVRELAAVRMFQMRVTVGCWMEAVQAQEDPLYQQYSRAMEEESIWRDLSDVGELSTAGLSELLAEMEEQYRADPHGFCDLPYVGNPRYVW